MAVPARSAATAATLNRFEAVLRELKRAGLLLQQDKKMSNVVGIVTGEPLSGSWWSHPRGQEIFSCLDQLVDRDDVLMTRLIARKVTFVHKTLWPALFAVSTSREAWQTRGLSSAARALLRGVDASAEVEATGAPARELQERLLVAAMQIHTDEGSHAVQLRPWQSAIGRVKTVAIDDAKRQIEEATIAIGGTAKMLPWPRQV